MATLEETITIPAESGRAFSVDSGKAVRIIPFQGVQVADAVVLNQHDSTESFHADMTVHYNQQQGLGDLWQVKKAYSRPPHSNLMFTVTKDLIGKHYFGGGMCTSKVYDLGFDLPDHPNCSDILLSALRDYGISLDVVPDVFNVGLHADVIDGKYVFLEPTFDRDDFVEIEAEMDLTIAVSACPNDTHPINEYEPKPLLVEIYDSVPET